jgi:hypothetical protein
LELRVIPAELPHTLLLGSFTIHDLEHLRAPVVTIRTLSGRLYLEPPATTPYVIGFDRLRALSLDAPTVIRQLLETLEAPHRPEPQRPVQNGTNHDRRQHRREGLGAPWAGR